MQKQLNYIFPDENAKVVSTNMDPDMEHFESWLYSMMHTMPGVNFFFTTDTTDIFQETA